MDFLKANPFMTMEDYMWKYSIPMIRIMGMDNSRVNYLSEKEIENRKFNGYKNVEGQSADELNKEFGLKL